MRPNSPPTRIECDEDHLTLRDMGYLFPRKYCHRRDPMSDAIDDVVAFIIENDKPLADAPLDDGLCRQILALAKDRLKDQRDV
jgi:hypothetical protein